MPRAWVSLVTSVTVVGLLVQAAAGQFCAITEEARTIVQSSGQMYNTGKRPGSGWVIGQSSGMPTDGKRRVYVKFDLSAIPSCAVLTGVTLEAQLSKVKSLSRVQVAIHRITAEWSVASQNWGTSGEGIASPASFSVVGVDGPGDAACRGRRFRFCTRQWSSSGMLADVKAWLANPSSNEGWVLIGDESCDRCGGTVQKYSTNSFTLKLTYSNPTTTTATTTTTTATTTLAPTTTTTRDLCAGVFCDTSHSRCIHDTGQCAPCDEGYYGDPTVFCQAVDCPSTIPGLPAEAEYESSFGSCFVATSYGDTCDVKCKAGYKALGTTQFVCGASGGNDWAGSLQCVDIDECALLDLCDSLTTCEQSFPPGSGHGFTCTDCPDGYTTERDSKTGQTTCKNINECLASDSCEPDESCADVDGSFQCSKCEEGFHNPDGSDCVDINECPGGCHPVVSCDNTPGSFVCGPCPDGYLGDGVGRNGCTPKSCGALSPVLKPVHAKASDGCVKTTFESTCTAECRRGYVGATVEYTCRIAIVPRPDTTVAPSRPSGASAVVQAVVKAADVGYVTEDDVSPSTSLLSEGVDRILIGRTGINRGSSIRRRGLVRFDISGANTTDLNAVAVVMSLLQLKNGELFRLAVHRITSPWDARSAKFAQVTYSGAASAVADRLSLAENCAALPCNRIVTSDGMKADVLSWMQGEHPNYGWVLLGDEDTQESMQKYDAVGVELQLGYGNASLAASDNQGVIPKKSLWNPALGLVAIVVGTLVVIAVLRITGLLTPLHHTMTWARRRLAWGFSLGSILMVIGYLVVQYLCVEFFSEGTGLESDLGFLALGNAFLVVVFVSRNGVITWALGFPMDSIVWIHRAIGRALALIATLHGVLFLVKWGDGGIPLAVLWTETRNLYGLVAWISLFLIFILSLPQVRRPAFEVFYYTHFLFIVFYAFLWLHSIWSPPYMYATVAVYGLDKLVRNVAWFTTLRATKVALKDGDVVQIAFPKPRSLRNFRSGQYVMMCFPQMDPVNWHPISVSSGPQEAEVEVTIRAIGGWSARLVSLCARYTQDPGALKMLVDGPYGATHGGKHRYTSHLYVTGGIGVTPVMSLLREQYDIGLDVVAVSGRGARRGSKGVSAIVPTAVSDTSDNTSIDFLGGSEDEGSIDGHEYLDIGASLPAVGPETTANGGHEAYEAFGDIPLTDLKKSASPEAGGDSPLARELGRRHAKGAHSITLVWAIRSASHYSWFQEALEEAQARAGTDGYPELHLKVFVTSNKSDLEADPATAFLPGRPNLPVLTADVAGRCDGGGLFAFACGPSRMVYSTWDSVYRYSREDRTLFHRETYEW